MPNWYVSLVEFCRLYPEMVLILPAVVFALSFLVKLSLTERFLCAFTFPLALAYFLLFNLPISDPIRSLLVSIFLAPQILAVLVTGSIFAISRLGKHAWPRDSTLVWVTAISIVVGHLWTRFFLAALAVGK